MAAQCLASQASIKPATQLTTVPCPPPQACVRCIPRPYTSASQYTHTGMHTYICAHTHTHTQGLSLPHGYLVGRGRAMVLPVARRGMGGETPGEEVPSLCPVRPHPGHCTKVRCTCGVGVHLHMGPGGCSQRPVLKERVLRPRAAQPRGAHLSPPPTEVPCSSVQPAGQS